MSDTKTAAEWWSMIHQTVYANGDLLADVNAILAQGKREGAEEERKRIMEEVYDPRDDRIVNGVRQEID